MMLFVFSNITLALWNISDLLINFLPSEWVLIADRFSYLFALFVVPSFFLLLMDVGSTRESKLRVPKILSVALVFFAAITFSPLLIREVKTNPTFQEVPGPLYGLFVIYFLSWLLYGLYVMYNAYLGSHGFKKNQLKYFFLALVIAFIAAINYFVCMFSRSFPPFYYLIEILYTLVVAYAVVRYKLMDFDLLVRWGIVLGSVLAIGSLIIAGTMITTEIFSKKFHTTPGLPTLIGFLILVGIYEPLRRKILKHIDQFIYQSPDFKEILEGINESVSRSNNVQQLAIHISQRLQDTWKVDHAGLVVWDAAKSEFIACPTEIFDQQIIGRVRIPITTNDFLIKTLESERRLFNFGVILMEEVRIYGNRAFPGEKITFQKIRRTMRWLGAEACVPIINSNQLIAFMVLGSKKTGKSFNKEDKKILSHIAEMLSPSAMKFVCQS